MKNKYVRRVQDLFAVIFFFGLVAYTVPCSKITWICYPHPPPQSVAMLFVIQLGSFMFTLNLFFPILIYLYIVLIVFLGSIFKS